MAKWYPSHSRYRAGTENYLWIYVHPRRLSYESILNNYETRNIINVQEDTSLEKFYFLAPQEIQPSLNHSWEPLENIMTRLADMIGKAQKSINLGKTAHKVDTPLVYSDSDRRKISFTVNLGVYDNPEKDVMEPVKLLRTYSSPSLYGQTIFETKVTMPNVFKVATVLGNGRVIPLLNIQHAALTSVQPTFKGPYIKGFPSHCELTLTFQDMEPVSKESYDKITINRENVPYGVG